MINAIQRDSSLRGAEDKIICDHPWEVQPYTHGGDNAESLGVSGYLCV